MKTAETLHAICKGVTRVAACKINEAYIGYEMGCLISAEFCPPPDYCWVIEYIAAILGRYGVTLEDYTDWLYRQSRKCQHPYQSPVYKDIYYVIMEQRHDVRHPELYYNY